MAWVSGAVARRAGGPPVSRVWVEGDVVLGRRRGRGPRAVVTVAVAVGGGEELDGVGDDLDRFALGVLVRPFAPFQAPVDRDRAALGEEAGAALALRAPD